MHSILNRAVNRAMARDKVKRNVVAALRGPDRAGRPAVEVADARPGRRRCSTARRGLDAARLHRAVAADRRPHRGTAGAALGPCRPRRQAGRRSARPPSIVGAALGPRTAGTPRRASPAAASPCPAAASTRSPRHRGPARPHAPDRRRRSCSPPRNGTELDAPNVRRAFRRVATAAGLDPAAWTPASCGTASSRCCPTRACRWSRSPACRPQRHRGHRAGLPPSAPAGPGGGRRQRWTSSSRLRSGSHSVSHSAVARPDKIDQRRVSAGQSGWS